jgi:ABC-type multidrug transport system ATPase subunit
VKKSTQFRSVYDTNVILKNINGRAESGQLLAVMGPTGCGKTSLLNILAARMPSGGSQNMELSGQVCINGTPRNDDKLRRKSAYVLQDDNMFAHITVLETLTLASHFYLPTDVPDTIKSDLVMEIVGQLGLSKTLHTIIGNERDKGISGGERKRVNIAVQMLSQPMMLFLDEPTSGLDSFQALSVMECMKDLAMNGRLVVAVIHQPRSSIFELFDRLLLLSAGSTMFMGPAGDAMNWFQQCGFGCPRLYNPSDYFLDILSTDIRTVESEKLSNERIETFARMWAETETLESLTLAEGPKMVSAKADYLNCTRITRNLKLLGWRAFTQSRRDLIPIFSKFVFIIFFALVIGGIFADLGNNQKSISNRIGLLFVIGCKYAKIYKPSGSL